ncbi:unnamed protein product, partial [Ixodes pacificus]
LNSIEPSIQFTREVEQNNTLPFLDVTVCRSDTGHIETTVYRKPCDTGNFLSFNSHHPVEHKRAVVRTLINRSEHFPSNSDLRASEVQTVVGSLLRRGYSKGFIENTPNQMQQGRTKAPNNYKAGVVTIPYVKGVAESIRRSFLPLGIRTTFKPHIKLRDLISKPKDPTPPESQSGVVYKVNCQDCDKCYIGETGRKQSTRLKEHRRDV